MGGRQGTSTSLGTGLVDSSAGTAQFELVAVELGDELLDELRFGGLTGVAGLLDDPAALTADPAAADVEDLNGRFEFVVGEGDHVGVGAVTEHHRLLLQRPLERADVVAQPGGALEVEFGGRGAHPVFQLRANRSVLPDRKSQKFTTISRCSSALTRPTHGAEHLSM